MKHSVSSVMSVIRTAESWDYTYGCSRCRRRVPRVAYLWSGSESVCIGCLADDEWSEKSIYIESSHGNYRYEDFDGNYVNTLIQLYDQSIPEFTRGLRVGLAQFKLTKI